MTKKEITKEQKREIALANLEKAMAVKRGEVPPKPKPDSRVEASRQRLEKIAERVEKKLSDGDAIDKADSMKLATTLKVCHNLQRALNLQRIPQHQLSLITAANDDNRLYANVHANRSCGGGNDGIFSK